MPSRKLYRALVTLGIIVGLNLVVSAQQPDYVLGPQDVFTITVYGPGGATERFTVEADGTFTFPILGRVAAGGLTVRQLQDALVNRLREGYFNEPRVTVIVEEYRSQRIFVVGEVKTPGTFALTRQMTLVEALTLAGAPTANVGSVAVVRRRTNGTPSRTPVTEAGDGVTEVRVDLTALQDGVLSNNPTLRDGDTITVLRAAPVYVFGLVNRPGEYVVGKDTTIRQVLSMAGGIAQRGAAGRIKVLRASGGVEHEIKAELDDRVKPGDTIVVPERFF